MSAQVTTPIIVMGVSGCGKTTLARALADALGSVARARGMTDIAKASGITREALYKALRPNASPRFETVSKVCAALGVRLVAQPIHAQSDGRPAIAA